MYGGDSAVLKHGKPPAEADVLIVGAGPAGLYTAWRLVKHDPDQKVVVVERLGRTGGRLDTDRVPVRTETDANTGATTVTEVKDEEGGMRFNYSMQELIQLSHDLNLCDEIVNFGSGGPNNRYLVRGHGFTVAEAEADEYALWSEIYNLAPAEQGKGPVGLITEVYHAILAENGVVPPDDPQPDFWQDLRLKYTYRGIPLNQWGLWNLLREYGLSEEAVSMMVDTFGFEGPFLSGEVSAGEAFQILEDFPANPVYYAYNQGFSTLPDTLAEQVVEMGGEIYVGVDVTSVEGTGDDLTIKSRPTPGVDFRGCDPSWGSGTTRCKRTVLAIPRNAMTALAAVSPALNGDPGQNARLEENIASVAEMVLLKVNLYYHTAWWHDGLIGQPIIADGGNFTNLPAGSFYVFDPVEQDPQGPAPPPDDPSRNGPAALTLYCDFNRANFWIEAQDLGEQASVGYFRSPLQEHYDRAKPQVIFPASNAVVEEMTRQLKQVFDTYAIPRPVLSSFRAWDGKDGFGYAYHQWRRGADDSKVIPFMAHPVDGVNVYTCNECWSDMQGWVNGSLRSAEVMLTQHFGLQPLIPDPDTWQSPCRVPPPPPPEPGSTA